MIRGLRFEIPNEWGSLLQKIFDGILVENYFWRLRDDDAYANVFENANLFDQESYHGPDFKQIIIREKYYILALGLLAFPAETDEKVYDYPSFMDSTAEFFVMIVDSIFVDIYAKEKETLELFEKAAQKHGFAKIEFFTEENDRFAAWDA